MYFAENNEIDKMLSMVDLRDPFGVRDHNMLTIARHTGLRVAELVGLDVHDVFDGKTVRETLYVRPDIAKGEHDRTVPLNSAARQAILRQLDFNKRRGFSTQSSAPLFVNRYHRRVIIRDVQRIMKSLREKAGLATPVTPHSVRRNFACRVASTSGNLMIVKEVLGHERLNTCQIYVRVSEAEKAAAIERLVE